MEWQTDVAVSFGRPQGAPGNGPDGVGNFRVPGLFFDRAERAPRLLSEDQDREIHEAALAFLKLYKQLLKLSIDRGHPRYKVIPKFHVFLHIAGDVWEYRLNFKFFFIVFSMKTSSAR